MSERRNQFSLRRQLRMLMPLVVLWAIGGAVVAVAGLQTRLPVTSLFLDATAISELPWYVGLLSNVGLLAWTVAAASALGGGWVAFQTNRASAGRFLTAGGAVATLLLLDDMFLLHSNVMPKLIGVPKSVAMLAVIGPAIAWFFGFSNEVLRTRWLILVLSLTAFFVSVAADQLLEPGSSAIVAEDGAKLMGVLAWALYFVLTTHDIARSTIRAAMVPDQVAKFVADTAPDRATVEQPQGRVSL